MTEEFIHYVWKYRLLPPCLSTADGTSLSVIHPGEHNLNSGPDFFNARIRIGNTLWAGNVEMHIAASDWHRHGHQGDPAYENTILHVVHEADAKVYLSNGQEIPTLAVAGLYPPELYSKYIDLINNHLWIPCAKSIEPHLAETFRLWSPALAIERLVQKSEALGELFQTSGGSWDETLYRFLAHGFGFKTNATAMELLARALPYKILLRHRGNAIQQEALLFGQAGMLKRFHPDDYPKRLRIEYEFLRDKYGLIPIREGVWKFMRLRPASFPTVRISQFARLVGKEESLTEKVLTCNVPGELFQVFSVQASDYWNDHFTFDRISFASPKKLGEDSIHLLAINVIAPFRFFYGRVNDLPAYREGATTLLESLPPERNCEIRKWEELGFVADHSLHSQALIQLKRGYCDTKRCLECRLGSAIMKTSAR